jgi:hypothetical protein
MEKKKVAGPKIAEVVGKIVDLLEPLDPAVRKKAIHASLTILGEDIHGGVRDSGESSTDHNEAAAGMQTPSGVSAKGKLWMKQNEISTAQLENSFEISGHNIAIIASDIPGNGDKGKTHSAYVLEGIRSLLATGDPVFDDKSARAVCASLGCYDPKNHASTMKAKGNILTGSKSQGWRLTGPGLRRGAEIVKEIAQR